MFSGIQHGKWVTEGRGMCLHRSWGPEVRTWGPWRTPAGGSLPTWEASCPPGRRWQSSCNVQGERERTDELVLQTFSIPFIWCWNSLITTISPKHASCGFISWLHTEVQQWQCAVFILLDLGELILIKSVAESIKTDFDQFYYRLHQDQITQCVRTLHSVSAVYPYNIHSYTYESLPHYCWS